MIQKFKKKPVEIEAIQWNGNSGKKEIEDFVGKELKSELESETAYVAGKGAPIFSLLIETKEGVMKAMRGDWIIKGVKGEFYPCKPDIFALTYEEVVPENVLRAQKHIANFHSDIGFMGSPEYDFQKKIIDNYFLHRIISKN